MELCNKIQAIQTERMKLERKLEYIQYMTPSDQSALGETIQCLKNKIAGSKEEEFRNLWMIQMSPMTIHEIVGTINRQTNQIQKISERVDELEKIT